MSDLLNLNIAKFLFWRKKLPTGLISNSFDKMNSSNMDKLPLDEGESEAFSVENAALDGSYHCQLPLSPETHKVQDTISTLVQSIAMELAKSSPVSETVSHLPVACPTLVDMLAGTLTPVAADSMHPDRFGMFGRNTCVPVIADAPPVPLMLDQLTAAFAPESEAGAGGEDSLPQVLHALDDEDDDCIVVVRRITKLGFKSARILKERFRQLGWGVKKVVTLPSRARTQSFEPIGQGGLSRIPTTGYLRPSSMGFVVFDSRDAARDCLERGSVLIDRVEVIIKPFVRQYRQTAGITHDEDAAGGTSSVLRS
jgi:hypothetical protein